MADNSSIQTFRTAEQYLRTLHPDFNFLFTIIDTAVHHWGYTLEDACELQSRMVGMACEHAKKLDAQRGSRIIVEDETCSVAAHQ